MIAQKLTVFGSYGVQLFFVMSAFTLCHSLKKVPHLNAREYGAFMLRRFFRIAPMYYLAIVAYYAFTIAAERAAFPSIYTSLATYQPANVVSNFLFVHGLYPPGNNGVVPGGWSIGCEFLFYAIFPFLFYTVSRRPRALIAAAVIALLATFGMVVAKGFFGQDQTFSGSLFLKWFVTTQFPCFLFGMALYFHGEKAVFRKWIKGLALPSLALAALLHDSPWGWIFTPFLAGVASVALAQTLEGKASLPGWLLLIGQASFSLYLVHFIAVMILGSLYRTMLPLELQNSLSMAFCFLLVLAVSLAFSRLTLKVVETPGINLGKRLADTLVSKKTD